MDKQIVITVGPDGTISSSAYCLPTDLWQDYLYFLNEAEVYDLRGKKRSANRCLRAALLCLFSHLEGMVHQICLEKTIPGSNKNDSFAVRIHSVHQEATKLGAVPAMNIRFGKSLRDIIAHPGIKKHVGDNVLTEVSIYEELSVATLRSMGEVVNTWLEAVCSLLGIERFTDTKSLAEDLGEQLGSLEGTAEV
jgi:hypothetical protein